MASPAKKSVNAKITGSSLIVSFVSDGEPKIWRGDLARLPTAEFVVKANDGKFSLVMKSGSDSEEIMSFADKQEAMAAWQTISDTMMGEAESPVLAPAARKKSGWFKKLCKFLFVLLVLFVGFVVWVNLRWSHIEQTEKVAPPQVKTGVPVPASELFGK